jgi:hypothetical protein
MAALGGKAPFTFTPGAGGSGGSGSGAPPFTAGAGAGAAGNVINRQAYIDELKIRGFTNANLTVMIPTVGLTKRKLAGILETQAGLNNKFKSIIPNNNIGRILPFKGGLNKNKHAIRFKLYRIIQAARVKPENLANINLANLNVSNQTKAVDELKKLVEEAKNKKLKGVRNGENLGAGVIFGGFKSSNKPGEKDVPQYYYKNNKGNRYNVKKNIGGKFTNRWSATIGSGGPLSSLTGKKITFKYTISSDGKPHFELLKNNNTKNKMNSAPPTTGAVENYSSMNVFKLLGKYKEVRNKERREAIEKAINSKLEQAVSNLKYKNTSYRITQYSEILRALHTRSNFPGRSIIVGSIRNDIRRAAKSSNAKYEMERIRNDLKLSLLPVRDRNLRDTFNKEFRIVKNRERRYESAYGGDRRRNNNYGGGMFGGGRPRFNMGGPPPRFNMGGPPPRYNARPALNTGAPPLTAVAQPKFNITGAAPPRINLPPVNIGTAAAPASGALPVNLPANEATAIRQLGGVNAAANKINQAGGATNVAKTANALEKAGGNQNRAVTEFGADPKALKLVIEVAGPTRNYNRVNNALNGLNKVATKIRRKRKRVVKRTVTKKRVVKRTVTKKRTATKAPVKKRAVSRVVRTGELNKLLRAVTKNTIEHRMNNANLLNKVYTKAELAKIYKKFLMGNNLKK